MKTKTTVVGWTPYGNDRVKSLSAVPNQPGNGSGYEMLAARNVTAKNGATTTMLMKYDFSAGSRFLAHRTTTRDQNLPTKAQFDTLSLGQGALEYIIWEVNSDAAVTDRRDEVAG